MRPTIEPLTKEAVRRLFHYDSATGNLIWKVRTSRRVKVGDIAGGPHSQGYVTLSANGSRQLAHRVVWLWWYGVAPDGDIDHINRVRNDNRIENLRCVSRSENLLNSEHKQITGHPGVVKVPSGRFAAGIHVNRRRTYIGTFDTLEEAALAYAKKHIEEYGVASRFNPLHVNPHVT